MKPLKSNRLKFGFTLIELLVVIAIIGILAAILLSVLQAARTNALKKKALLEAVGIANAIQAYDSAYGHFPVSAAAQAAANGGDFTYGGSFQAKDGSAYSVGTPVGGAVLANSEVVSILMSLTNYPTGGSTINTNYEKNPQRTPFLNAKMTGDTSSPGVGTDLVYRDPFGNPYVITMDLSYDDQCKDTFYCLDKVSHGGLNGLVNPDGATATTDNWQCHYKVMVWSAGPPKLNGKPVVDATSAANSSYNKNHIVSW